MDDSELTADCANKNTLKVRLPRTDSGGPDYQTRSGPRDEVHTCK